MTPRIRILPPEVVDRIAAGEVIERPASVVKELVENSLDAGATRIAIAVAGGGVTRIAVTDDGHGMTAEELALAVQRHATSKIRCAEDLFALGTLGFRGEALPSIAAVSRMEIVSRAAGTEEGARLELVAGQVRASEAVAAPPGTSVTVTDLFFNVPVRRRFLRSEATESAALLEAVKRLALSAPQVRFRLIQDGREILLTPGGDDPLAAVVAVFGRPVARELLPLPVTDAEAAIRIRGFIGRPSLTRSTRGHEYFFVNGRAVRSPLFYRALDDVYRATMPAGRYPVAIVFVDLPPAEVDANVHPMKQEVRFADEGAVYARLVAAMRGALAAPEQATGYASRSTAEAARHHSTRVSEAMRRPSVAVPPDPHPFASQAIRTPGERPAAARPAEAVSGRSAPGPAREALPRLRYLGQAHYLFLLAESDGELWIVDQHVAHERILFDRLTAAGTPQAPQPLLLPPTIELDPSAALALETHRTALQALGFVIEPFGPNAYRLVAVPAAVVGREYEAIFRDLVDTLAEMWEGGQPPLAPDSLARAAAGRACKAAVKAGQPLSAAEAGRLLAELRASANPYTCPHGRPVFLTFDADELRRRFGDVDCEPAIDRASPAEYHAPAGSGPDGRSIQPDR